MIEKKMELLEEEKAKEAIAGIIPEILIPKSDRFLLMFFKPIFNLEILIIIYSQ